MVPVISFRVAILREQFARSLLKEESRPIVLHFFSSSGRMEMTTFARLFGMSLLAFALVGGTVSAQGWQHLGSVQSVEKLKDGVELTAGAAKVRVTVFREGVFRVRVTPNGTFPKDFSWAVIES